MKYKKTQITIFIILGIVIVVIVSLVYTATTSTRKSATKTELKKSEEARLETQPIKTFIENCVSMILKDGLELIGQQGGRLTRVQGGTLARFGNIDNASYSIYPPNPYLEDPYELGLYGDDNLPHLTREGSQSIQLQLERYITNRLDECDFSTFEAQALTITKGTPDIDVTIAKDDVDVRLNYPLDIESASTGAETRISEFSISQRVRLGRIYEFAAYLVRLDTIDISFDIADPANFRDGMSIAVERNAAEYDDIITITDPGSLLKGSPYEFRFARYNRKPLVYSIIPDVDLSTFSDGDTIYLQDMTNTPDEDIRADDPDEDFPLTVFFRLLTPADPISEYQDFGIFLINQAGQIIPSSGAFMANVTCPLGSVQVCAKDDSGLEPYCLDLEPAIC
jgi:hypothetical protein